VEDLTTISAHWRIENPSGFFTARMAAARNTLGL
jgi:hypothetical protein